MKREGILYIATGENFIDEAINSAVSVKKVMPEIPLAIYTNKKLSDETAKLFDVITIIHNPKFSFSDKIPHLINTPFERTLFLDTDTVMLNPVWELFELLDQFDIAYCHAPWRQCPGENNQLQDVPDCFSEANTGVLAFKNSCNVKDLFGKWQEVYSMQLTQENPPNHDPPAFRRVLYSTNARAYVLPPEYNTRTPMPIFKGGGIPVKILHGRGNSLARALAEIANDKRIGVYDFSKQTIRDRMISKFKKVTMR
jgi:hypothetical protein